MLSEQELKELDKKDAEKSKEGKFIDGYGVYHWLEFQAFARRLGIALDRPTTRLTISIEEGECPKVIHEYHGKDMNAPRKEHMADSTTLYNEGWRSKAPLL